MILRRASELNSLWGTRGWTPLLSLLRSSYRWPLRPAFPNKRRAPGDVGHGLGEDGRTALVRPQVLWSCPSAGRAGRPLRREYPRISRRAVAPQQGLKLRRKTEVGPCGTRRRARGRAKDAGFSGDRTLLKASWSNCGSRVWVKRDARPTSRPTSPTSAVSTSRSPAYSGQRWPHCSRRDAEPALPRRPARAGGAGPRVQVRLGGFLELRRALDYLLDAAEESQPQEGLRPRRLSPRPDTRPQAHSKVRPRQEQADRT